MILNYTRFANKCHKHNSFVDFETFLASRVHTKSAHKECTLRPLSTQGGVNIYASHRVYGLARK